MKTSEPPLASPVIRQCLITHLCTQPDEELPRCMNVCGRVVGDLVDKVLNLPHRSWSESHKQRGIQKSGHRFIYTLILVAQK